MSMWRLMWHFTRQESVTGAPYNIKVSLSHSWNTRAKSMTTGTVPSSGRSGTVCVCFYAHYLEKNDADRITELNEKNIYFGVKKLRSSSRTSHIKTLPPWVFALLRVLATSSFILLSKALKLLCCIGIRRKRSSAVRRLTSLNSVRQYPIRQFQSSMPSDESD